MNTAMIFNSPEPLVELIRSLGSPKQHDHHVMVYEAERRRKLFRNASDTLHAAVMNGTWKDL